MRHREKIENLQEWKKKPDHFHYSRLFDPYIKREYEMIRTTTVTNGERRNPSDDFGFSALSGNEARVRSTDQGRLDKMIHVEVEIRTVNRSITHICISRFFGSENSKHLFFRSTRLCSPSSRQAIRVSRRRKGDGGGPHRRL